MTAQALPNSGLTAGFTDAEDGWGESMNTNLRVLDALVNLRVEDKDLTAPPGSPVAGQVYIVGAGATVAWAGQAGKLAIWCVGDDITSAWMFVTPKSGWRAWVIDESADYRYTAGAWVLVPSGGGGGSTPITWNEKNDHYTLGLADAENGVVLNAATGKDVSVPVASTVAFPTGTTIVLYQEGDGLLTVVANSGVTIVKRGGGPLVAAGKYALLTLVKRASNTWILSGDLAA